MTEHTYTTPCGTIHYWINADAAHKAPQLVFLPGITGVYQTPRGYYVSDADAEKFDNDYPPKEKLKLPGQLF